MRKSTWTALGVIVIVAAAVIIYAVAHKPAKATTTTSTATSQTKVKSQPSNTVMETATASGIGQYLTDLHGNALYTYGLDKTGVSNCTGGCLASWPIYDASNAPATLPANVTVITRSDGGKQYAYKGLPLYTFSGDSSGQVTGDGISNFHLAKP
ncbi:MAG TPA: hypothetical protein VLG13_01885 [Patescibacteria group bacterium]|nr:hypothetical protein [Patescibacteria group bacterium]